MLMPGLLLAQAIGRWGNYFNQEAYGPEIQNPLFQFFPLGVLIEESGVRVWHMATFFYESLWNLCGFLLIWFLLRKRSRRDGTVFLWYWVIYGSGRFLIEQLRQDSLYLLGFRVSQWLSFGMVLPALALLLVHALRANQEGPARHPSAKQLGLSFLCSALWVCRWLCLDSPWIYVLLWLSGGVAAALLLKKHGLPIQKLIFPFVLDGVGVLMVLLGLPLSAAFALRLHRLISSATLPFYGMAFVPGGQIPEKGA